MSVDPILQSGFVIVLHVVAAIVALGVGVVQLVGIKGTQMHKLLGWGWVVSMLVVAVTSFWIHEIRLMGLFSPIHFLSVFVLINLPIAVIAARKHNIRRHKLAMYGMFGGIVAAGAFSFLPGRVMNLALFGG